jgi:cell division protein DivIC
MLRHAGGQGSLISSGKVIVLVTSLVVAYFLVTTALGAARSYQLHQREGSLRSEIQELQSRYERLDALRAYLNSDEYIEAAAREQLGLVREGETGIIAIAAQPSPTPSPDDPRPELWWDVLVR